jgi:adenylate cyclase
MGWIGYAWGLWWPVMISGTGSIFALLSGMLINYATEGRQKAFLKRAFRQYLSPEVIDDMLRDPGSLKLGGEKKELTIFFSDIEKFSSFSERLDPETLTRLLNDFLGDMTRIILDEGGTLDKYIGDAIVAFWNAPVAQPDHAERALRAAWRCQQRILERQADFERQAGVKVRMRIGIHTGPVVVGNMGSDDRFAYTILGDAANLASRLEGSNKAFGTYLMVSESTWKRVQGWVGRELGALRVVGRQTPVRVFEPVGPPETPVPAVVNDFAKGLQAVYSKDIKHALECFGAYRDDAPSRIYATRCEALLAKPDETWDGVWNLTEK